MATHIKTVMFIVERTGIFYMRHKKIRFRSLLPVKEVDREKLRLSVIYLSSTDTSVSREKVALVRRIKEDPFRIPSG